MLAAESGSFQDEPVNMVLKERSAVTIRSHGTEAAGHRPSESPAWIGPISDPFQERKSMSEATLDQQQSCQMEQLMLLQKHIERVQELLQNQQRQLATQNEHFAAVASNHCPTSSSDSLHGVDKKLQNLQDKLERVEALLHRQHTHKAAIRRAAACGQTTPTSVRYSPTVYSENSTPKGKSSRVQSAGTEVQTRSGRSLPGVAERVTSFGRSWIGVDATCLEEAKGWRNDAQELNSNMRLTKATLEDATCFNDWFRMKYFTVALVLLNTAFIGLQVELNLHASVEGTTAPEWMKWMDLSFTVALIAEILARAAIERTSFMRGVNRWWNLFDLVFAISAAVDSFFALFDLSFVRALRMFRIIRAARIIRTVRVIRDLRLMIASILCSMLSIAWALILLFFCLYIFAILIMQSVQMHIDLSGGEAVEDSFFENYGSIPRSLFTLFAAISGGADWVQLVEPLGKIHWLYKVVFIFYVSFVVFGVMNILTAIFVERASQIANIDEDLAIQDEIARTSSTINAIRRFFHRADEDGDGIIHRNELEAQLADPEVLSHMKILGVEVSEARGLFGLLDIEERGEVDISEFVSGMMRLKGQAKGLDTATLMYEHKRLFARLVGFMRFVEDRFLALEGFIMPLPEGTESQPMTDYVAEEAKRLKEENIKNSNPVTMAFRL